MLQEKELNKNTPIPLYYQLETLILDEIKKGSYPAGTMIPTEKELSEMFNISRTTVRQAVMDLVQKEYLYRTKSKGTFVAHPKTNQSFMHTILSYDEDVRASGRIPSTEVLKLDVATLPPEIAGAMELDPGDKAVLLYRKRLVDDEPFVRVKTYLPYELCKNLLECDFTKESLYNVLSKRPETHVVKIARICEARAANSEDVKILGVKRGTPIHYFCSIGYNQAGRVIEYSEARYPGDRSKFRVVISRD